MIQHAELAEGGFGFIFAREEAGISGEEGVGFFFGFPQQFETEGLQAEFFHAGDVFGGALGLGVEDGVAAADIGDQRMRLADAVAEVELVVVTGAAAVSVVFSV